MTAPSRLVQVEYVMGTAITFDVRDQLPEGQLRQAIAAAVLRLHEVDRDFSTYREDSWVRRLQRQEVQPEACPPDVRRVLDLCEHYRHLTQGWFDAAYAGPGTVDPTGLVKGWATAAAVQVLQAAGLQNACVNAGGDVLAIGLPEPGRAWSIGIVDPADAQSVAERVVGDPDGAPLAVATSGVQQRGQHVLNPHTQQPAAALRSATATGVDLTACDVWATALMAAGAEGRDLERAIEAQRFGWFSIGTDGGRRASHGWSC